MDAELEFLSRLRAGDEDAFVMLVGSFHQPMLRLAQSIVSSPALAEDAVQDTWMGVVRGIDRFEGRSSFKTWLFRILVNRARSVRSQEPVDLPLQSLHSVDPNRFDSNGQWADPLERWPDDTDNRLDAAAWSPVLWGALEMLPDRQRQVVLLRDVEGLSNGEVCSVLGIGSGNQRILLHRGRARLRDIIEDQLKKD